MGLHVDWKAFGQRAMFLAPILLPTLGVPAELINLVVHGVIVAEQAAHDHGDVPKTGAEKKEVAMELVKTGLKAVNAAKPGTVDETQLLDAVSNGIDATVKGINAAKNIPAHSLQM